MFNLEEAYLGMERAPQGKESDESAVDWSLLGIYADYLRDQELPRQAEGIDHLMTNRLRPRSGILHASEGNRLEYWWYYHSPTDPDYYALNMLPEELARLLTGKVVKEGSSAAIIVYSTFTEAVQDFARAWERWLDVQKYINENSHNPDA